MSIFDHADIEEKHAAVRRAIHDGEPGYAQSDVSGTMVSLHLDGGFNTQLTHLPLNGMKAHDIIEEMIVDVASSEGIASRHSFRRSLVDYMIDHRRAYPEHIWPKKHAEADRLQALLANRPELFV